MFSEFRQVPQGGTVIEKRTYEDGGDYDRNRGRNVNGKANAALALGIIGTVGTALGAAALWNRGGNNGLGSLLGSGTSTTSVSGGYPANVNINANGGPGSGMGCTAPTAFGAYEKECSDVLELTNAMWGLKVAGMADARNAREVDTAEKFGLYKTMVDADFGLYKSSRDNIDAVNNRLNSELFSLYKYTRDKDDETRDELCKLRAEVAEMRAVRPYQDKLIQCEIEKAYTAGINYVDRKTCKMVEGTVVIPTTPEITGIGSYCCNRQSAANGGGAA